MYVSTNPGLGARRRRGLGAAMMYPPTGGAQISPDLCAVYPAMCPGGAIPVQPTVLPCCADAAAAAAGGCDDSCIAGSTPEQAINQMQYQIYALQNRANAAAPSSQWITGISNTVVGVGAAAFAGLLLMKALR